MDFIQPATRSLRGGGIEVYPKFLICPTKDLMIRGRDFYAVWLEDQNRWTTEEYDVVSAIDNVLRKKAEELGATSVAWMWDADTKSIDKWHYYCTKQQHDNWVMLDSKLMFSNQEVKREDYVTKCLPYELQDGPTDSYEELMSTLYSPIEKQKFEWMVGSILSGDSRTRDKCFVFFGAPGTGKSTALNIVESLFPGYCQAFSSKILVDKSGTFPLEQFKTNPLVAIDRDGNLSGVTENSVLNALISHEPVMVNEKHKAMYQASFQSCLLIATNTPVKITDSHSGLLRRIVDINPTGNKVGYTKYYKLVSNINYELGAIAYKCLKFYKENEHMFDDYEARSMMALSNDFYDFMIDMFHEFADTNETTLAYAYKRYLEYCTNANVNPMKKREFKTELKSYFSVFTERQGDKWYLYTGFLKNKFNTALSTINKKESSEEKDNWLKFNKTRSLFDDLMGDCPAQYTTTQGTPKKKWENVKTTLSEIDTKQLHFVKIPENYIVIDFDLVDENGNKSLEKNLEAASKYPETYAELSKSGQGIHLHYIYAGDVTKLSHYIEDKIEIKTFTGNSSLRRKLTKCNDIPIKQISWNLPIRGDTSVLQSSEVKTEQHLRCLIKKCLQKEYGSTTCNMDFISKLLDDAYNKVGFKYDVSDLSQAVLTFAANSTNQAPKNILTFSKMKFKSKDFEEPDGVVNNPKSVDMSAPIVFFDVEVLPNLFLVCYKEQGEGKPIHKLFNPTPEVVRDLCKFRLIGFNNRRYDNHMLYARLIGWSENEIYRLSHSIIVDKSKNAFFGQAYNLSYTDIYDFASAPNKMSLKKWEIELGLHHQEFNWDWNEPLPADRWEDLAKYCCNDVDATEKVFNHLAEDWLARQILAKLTNMTVNDTTNNLTAKFIFGDDKNPQADFNYRKMGEVPEGCTNSVITKENVFFPKVGDPEWNKFDESGRCWFPGYKFEYGKSLYRGEDPKEGGYVYAEPGIHLMVALLDIASQHPSTIIAEELFGKYTKRYEDMVTMRILIKHGELAKAAKMFDGALAEYLKDENIAKGLAAALKTAINAVYGLTFAHFANPFKDPRNVDNLVAKRGALFMINLKHEVQERGYTVAHIKTDSIKIPNATPEIIEFVKDYGKAYGYNFEHEATYDRMCLVNDSVYIAKYASKEDCISMYGYSPKENEKHGGEWTATGAQFQQPYVFKKCFTKEPIDIYDMAETKQSQTTMWLDMSPTPWVEDHKTDDFAFVGKIGQFTPVKNGGGFAVREATATDGTIKYDSVNGTKGHRWRETEEFLEHGGTIDDIDVSYYNELVDKAIDQINTYGDYYAFVA